MANIRRRSTCTVARIERRKLEILVIHMNQRIRVSFDVGNEEVVRYLLRFCFPTQAFEFNNLYSRFSRTRNRFRER